MGKKKRAIAAVISLFITIFLLYFLVKQVSLREIFRIFTIIPATTIILSFALYLGIFLFRALRFYVLLDGSVPMRKLLNIVAVHTLIGSTIPLRVGELSYIYLVKKFGTKGAKGLATLIISRIADVMVLSLFSLIILPHINQASLPKGMQATISIILLLLIAVLVLIVVFKKKFLHFIEDAFSRFRIGRTRPFLWVKTNIIATLDGFDVMKHKGALGATFLSTFAIWFLSFSLFYLLVISINLPLSFWQVAFLVVFLVFLPLLPIYGIGGFGTTEAATALVLLIFGIGKEQAILSSFVLHLISFLYTLVAGLIGLLLYTRQAIHHENKINPP